MDLIVLVLVVLLVLEDDATPPVEDEDEDEDEEEKWIGSWKETPNESNRVLILRAASIGWPTPRRCWAGL